MALAAHVEFPNKVKEQTYYHNEQPEPQKSNQWHS